MLCQYMQVYISSRIPGPEATHLHASRIKHVLRIIMSYIITMEHKDLNQISFIFLSFLPHRTQSQKKKLNCIFSNFPEKFV